MEAHPCLNIDEVLVHIFSYLDAKTLGSVLLVCQDFYRLTHHEDYWEDIFSRFESPFSLAPGEDLTWRRKCFASTHHDVLVEALELAQAKSLILYIKPGTYECQDIVLKNRVKIVGVGSADQVVLSFSALTSASCILVETTNPETPITICNITIRMRAEGQNHTAAVEVSTGILNISECHITSSGFGVRVGAGGANIIRNEIFDSFCAIEVQDGGRDALPVLIDENNIRDCSLLGLEVSERDNTVISRNKIHHIGHTAMRLNQSCAIVKENIIYENKNDGVLLVKSSAIVVDNDIHSHSQFGVRIHGGTPTVKKNRIHKNTLVNFYAVEGAIFKCTENHLYEAGSSGIYISDQTCSGLIENNDIYDNKSGGMSVKGNLEIANNRIYNNGAAGITVHKEATGVVRNNVVYNNKGGGVYLRRNASMTTEHNTETGNEILRPDIEECLREKTCTFKATGRTYPGQFWFYCDTCKPNSDEGCCAVCVETCHAGHQVTRRLFSGFYCDCGGDWGFCKAMKYK